MGTENKVKDRYNRIARFYDFLEYPMEKGLSRWREKLLEDAEGKTLEVGIGTGKNMLYYPEEVELTGIDFSKEMIAKAEKRLKKLDNHNNISLELMDVENMRYQNNAFDTVVTSCVFCSVPNPIQGLKQIKRVCKQGGNILMLEHVRSDKKVIGKFMDLLNPIPLHLYGANINRETYDNLIQAGFNPKNIRVENLWYDIVKLVKIDNVNND